jgi:hypothetical protein
MALIEELRDTTGVPGPLPYMISGKLYTTLTMYLNAYFIT